MKRMLEDLRKALIRAVKKKSYSGLLFSGGLDTSILAGINPGIAAVTVSLGSDAEDIPYSVSLAKFLNLRHFHRRVEVDEAIEAIPGLIRILKSFDPALPNDLAVYFGLETARNLNLKTVATGDGSDELFGGYSFMKDTDDLEGYIRRISEGMSFSTSDIGQYFDIGIIQPYLDKDIIDYALQVPPGLKIKRDKPRPFAQKPGRGRLWGKWILRKAFEDLLPEDIIWQSKRPLEYGSGMRRLRRIISERVCDRRLKRRACPVNLINREHLYYYEIYKKVVGEIPKPKGDQKACPGCGAGMERKSFHCKVCGYVLDWRVKGRDTFNKGEAE